MSRSLIEQTQQEEASVIKYLVWSQMPPPRTFLVQFTMNVYRIAIVLTIVGISESLGIRKYDYPLNENDLCGLEPATYSGKCKKVKKCVNLFVEQKEVEICSFQGTRGEETLVCCSREDFYKSRRLNNEGPLDYDNCLDTFRHLRKVEPIDSQQYVVNGLEVESHEFPHIAG